jgi:hypothetical protein
MPRRSLPVQSVTKVTAAGPMKAVALPESA